MRRIHLATLCILFAATLAARADSIYNFSLSGNGNQATPYSYTVTGTTTLNTTTGKVTAISFTANGSSNGQAYSMMFSGVDHQDGNMVYVGGNANGLAKFTITDPMHPFDNNSFNLQLPDNNFFDGHLINGTMVAASATPEPSSLALLGTGLLGTIGVLRRRLA